MISSPLYLGFDLSTQQLKAIVISANLSVAFEAKVDFDNDLGAKYDTTKGVRVNEAEGEVFTPVAMWIEALDLLLVRLRDEAGCPMDQIRAISGSGQQHGSIFWSAEGLRILKGLNGEGPKSDRALVELFSGQNAFAYDFSPNWQDHSTQAECDFFDRHLGSADKLADATGSSAHHRFTGSQIMRMRRRRPEIYAETVRISLVSSFLASLLLGRIAPIDISDVTGMNLWDIAAQNWSEPLLEIAAGSPEGVNALREKLGEVRRDGGGSMGSISHYLVDHYGFSADCQVAPFTGDNPATILALPLRPLDAIVSLGTSSTLLMITPRYQPDPSYHFMNHPTNPGQYMFMLCYKNGGLAREKIRDSLPVDNKGKGNDSWDSFNKAILESPPLGIKGPEDRAKMGLYFPLPEIVPNIRAGTWRYTFHPSDGYDLRKAAATWSPEIDARIIVESQALSMRLRSQGLVGDQSTGKLQGLNTSRMPTTLPAQPRRIYLVGGGSYNPAIARVFSDVLGGVEGVYRLNDSVGSNACALGGAYKAFWALERDGAGQSFEEFLVGRQWREDGAVQKIEEGYRSGVWEKYGGGVLEAFGEMEKKVREIAGN